jgi:NodT family efflux transporter outer membrane factor (OMF) lipoprotein
MVRARQIIVAGIFAALAGCAEVGPNYHVPAHAMVNAPTSNGAFVSGGSAVSGAPLPDHWWHLFNDPVLDGLVQKALDDNVDLKVAQANLERSKALVAEIRTNRDVIISAQAGTGYSQFSAEAFLQDQRPPEFEFYNIGLSASYDLDLFGGIRRGIEAVSAEDEAVEAARDLVRVNVAAETTRAYSDLCNAGHEIDVLQRLIAVETKDLAMTKELTSHGRAAPFEDQRQQSVIEGSRSQLPTLQARQLNAAFRLATLTGQPPEDYDRSWLACHQPLQLSTLLPTGDGRALLKRRPDVRAAERQLAAATAGIGVATAELYPDIKLTGSVGSTGVGSNFLSPLTNRFYVGPEISWNLHRDAIRDRIDAATAQSRASLAKFDSTVLSALRETETALDAYAKSLDQLQRLENARDKARVVSDKTNELWRGGRVGGIVALDAEKSWVAADAAVASAQAQVNTEQISAFLALGGGWQ